MKIVVYSHTGKVSGAENILLLLLKKLNRKRFTPVMICPKDGGLTEKVFELGIPVLNVDELHARFTWRIDKVIKYLISFVRVIRQTRSQLINEDADLIHANSIRAGLTAWAASMFTGKTVYWHLQDELPRHPFSTAIRLLVASSGRIGLLSASVATLNSFRGEILKIFRKDLPFLVVHNAIELDKFKVNSDFRGKIRKELNISDDETVFGIVGQITPRKGQLELIHAFAENEAELGNATLLIVGEPMFNQDHDYFDELKRTISEVKLDDKVKLLGHRRDVPEIMQAIDALVINSKSEAFVVVAIEAMACGTPVIATDVGGTREMIENNVNGWLIPFGDRRKLADALVQCATDPISRKRFSVAGQEIVESRLNAEKFISEIEDFFNENSNDKNVLPVLRSAES